MRNADQLQKHRAYLDYPADIVLTSYSRSELTGGSLCSSLAACEQGARKGASHAHGVQASPLNLLIPTGSLQ